MEKLTILLLLAAVLVLAQALIKKGGGEKRQKEKINFLSKRKTTAESWWEGECSGWSVYCTSDPECCSGECSSYYCELW
uniref:Conotoxin TsMEKL-P012 n=1 Tax=Conus tessulatus TaxID=101317 RepID=O262_CONTS|nr:RecName: Full=Conotoxin TsMEKL-P012; Flags: Precursor [Conus tessulatus]AAG60441.1 conotoxin scaffold VI/VII precursor [Conus tessulatus]